MSFTRFYYTVKPFLPAAMRIGLRRFWAKGRWTRYKEVWPINPAAGMVPPGWPGWPDGKRFAVVLTHDVEGSRGLERCRELLELDKALGFRSSFNFVPEGTYTTPRSLREWIATQGFEVGVHDLNHDGKLFWSFEGFQDRAKLINRYLSEWNAAGFRAGFMLRNPEWLHCLDIDYDASTFDTDPFEPQPEGVHTIFPFWVSASGATKTASMESGTGRLKSGYLELPYTLAQDSTMFLVLQQTDIGIWKQKLDWIVERGGMALLNVHPDYLSFSDSVLPREYTHRYYREFLGYIKKRYAGLFWQPVPRELAEYLNSSFVRQDARKKDLAVNA